MCNLAYCLENSIGVERDMDEAVVWYTRSAERGGRRRMNVCGP